MKLYNSMMHIKEPFCPADGEPVKIFSDVPFANRIVHIGELRQFIVSDVLRRALRYSGYRVKDVVSIPDAEKSDETSFYVKIFFDNLKKLNIPMPEITAYTSEAEAETAESFAELLKKGSAYETREGVYLDTEPFKQYGKMLRTGFVKPFEAEEKVFKKNPSDFALFEKSYGFEGGESPWGRGTFAGFAECSFVAKKYLGEVYDIRLGSVDRIPQHECELTFGQALSGHVPANVWMHTEIMQTDSTKAKNTYTLSDVIEKGCEPMLFRYFCLNSHYRKKLNFTFEVVNIARISYDRLFEHLSAHRLSSNYDKPAADEFLNAFRLAVEDDLNMPMALSVLFSMAKSGGNSAFYEAALEMDKVFGLEIRKGCEKN